MIDFWHLKAAKTTWWMRRFTIVMASDAPHNWPRASNNNRGTRLTTKWLSFYDIVHFLLYNDV